MISLEDKPSVYSGIDRRRVIKVGPNAGKSHVKIWVTFIVRENGVKKWKQRQYQTDLYCSVKDYDKMMAAKNAGNLGMVLRGVHDTMHELMAKAKSILALYPTQTAFESQFLSGYGVEEIDGEFESKIAELRAAKKFSSAENYSTALRSLKEFFKGKEENPVPVTYAMCTAEKLQEYENWYTDQPAKKGTYQKKSLTSVGINMRHFRHIFKRAIKRGVVTIREYPFGVGAYVIPEGGDDTKKFLGKEDKDALVTWRHPTDDRLNELHDYALFSYYGSGMNMSDLARLTKDRVFKEYITINRQKTKGKKKKNKVTIIPIHPVMREVIQRRGKKSLVPDDFVFPILEYGWEEEKIFLRTRKLIDEVNSVLAMIAKEKGFDIKPTTYTLRHTFSFHFMQQEGATTEDLQYALAHGSIKTTEAYKHGFSLERKKKLSDGL